MVKPLLCLLAVLVVTPSAPSAEPLETAEGDLSRCRFLGDVVGRSGYGKNSNWKPLARSYLENKATALGATNTTPIQYTPTGSFNGEARTKAYICP